MRSPIWYWTGQHLLGLHSPNPLGLKLLNPGINHAGQVMEMLGIQLVVVRAPVGPDEREVRLEARLVESCSVDIRVSAIPTESYPVED